MPSFFIDRPVFAWVIALVIMVAGALSLPELPVAQFPRLSPPRVEIDTTYPGATAETVDGECREHHRRGAGRRGRPAILRSQSDGLGEVAIGVTFRPGTNPDIAMVDVQNRMKQIESRLPQQVVQQGIGDFKVEHVPDARIAHVDRRTRDSVELGDYINRYMLREFKRAPGVGSAELWDAGRAMRIWIDPMKLREYGLAADDVTSDRGAKRGGRRRHARRDRSSRASNSRHRSRQGAAQVAG